jgi:hypothetical protein
MEEQITGWMTWEDKPLSQAFPIVLCVALGIKLRISSMVDKNSAT